jgi:hypothetical protein
MYTKFGLSSLECISKILACKPYRSSSHFSMNAMFANNTSSTGADPKIFQRVLGLTLRLVFKGGVLLLLLVFKGGFTFKLLYLEPILAKLSNEGRMECSGSSNPLPPFGPNKD